PQSAIIPTSQLDKPAPRVRDRPREKPANYIHPPLAIKHTGNYIHPPLGFCIVVLPGFKLNLGC
ncbi:MAG: hypothetical protein P5697_24515, partial [Limnospira sp. PMC 1256.20]|uniref:hypothetical protein n=2 Tax=Limnospira TaxID=2596745 RepID=UPI0028E119B6